MQEIANKLKGVFSIDIHEEPFSSKIYQTINEIKENKQTHGRSNRKLKENVSRGIALEESAGLLLGGEMNSRKFNHTDPETFAYDLTVNGENIEVKNVGWDDVWFNFNINEDKTSDNITRPILDTYIKNRNYSKYVLVGACQHGKNFSDFKIKYKWILRSETFMKYFKQSNSYRDGTTHYYDVRSAIRDGECIKIS